jgi:type II secretory pathway component PulL
MSKRPFFVMPDGTCVPLEGAWRVVELRGEWYVLGHHSVVPCGSQRAAHSMLEELESQTDADRLAAEAIAGLDPGPTQLDFDSLDVP